MPLKMLKQIKVLYTLFSFNEPLLYFNSFQINLNPRNVLIKSIYMYYYQELQNNKKTQFTAHLSWQS